jgi:ubiquinone/menaquinone biosynthesis C-methylase UbiE
MQTTTLISKTERVKALFDVPEKYLGRRRFDIQIRAETVCQFTEGRRFAHVLDIGCGDGSISLPLLPRCERLTLLDLSSNMLDLARSKIPVARLNDVTLMNQGFIGANAESQSFDLILCIGVLAHVDSPQAVIAEISRLLKPGGSGIIEFTDSFHPWGIPVVLYQKALKLLRPEPYPLNRLSARQIIDLCRKNGLRTSGLYRYGLPPIGSSKFLGQEEMYRTTRYLFGPSSKNRNGWMGNQFLYRLNAA